MSYELRKILGNRYVMLLLALAVAVNAALFYRRCTKDLGGFTRADVRAEYAHLDTLEQEYDALLNGIYGEDVDIMQVPDEDLRRYALLSTVRDEVEATNNYPEYLRGLCAETEAKLRLGLFSADPFAERTLEKGLAAYSALLGVRLEPSFPDGVEVLLDWRLTDLLLLLFAAVSGLVLLTGERSAGLMVLLRPTRRGHGALYWRKAAAMLATVLAGVVLLYGANLAVSAAVLGLGDPARPIQTIPSMQSCPVPLTVFGWLLCFVGEKLLWGWAVGALFFLLCTTTGRAWAAFLLAGGTKGKRYALPNAEIMIHQPSGGAQGQATEIKIVAEQILKTKEKLNKILAANTGQPLDVIARDTERDNYMTAEEAAAYGLIDRVITGH